MSTAPGSMPDLNDFYFFAAVVEHGGFSAAGRALNVPKSRLSKRVSQLEEGLGVRLLQRTTRRFVVTEAGERFYRHCQAMLAEVRAATEDVATLNGEPRGVVRMSCPVALTQTVLASLLPEFLAKHPKVQVRLLSNDRRVDLIGEGYDVAIRVRTKLDTDATLVLRTFGQSSVLPVASPALLETHGRLQGPEDLSALPALSLLESDGPQEWELTGPEGQRVRVEIQPRLVCGDFLTVLEAARRGIGVAMLPEFVCAPAIASGELEALLPDWSVPEGIMHFVYPSRRGLLPAVRALVDFLAEHLPEASRRKHEDCRRRAS
ncbi:MAG: LysR family transcriptional regulator [Rhodanobacteraceae bacterium]|nr:MAG: LysR family transcriptional regulator [Rhodanobacteraceae bacterium]